MDYRVYPKKYLGHFVYYFGFYSRVVLLQGIFTHTFFMYIWYIFICKPITSLPIHFHIVPKDLSNVKIIFNLNRKQINQLS